MTDGAGLGMNETYLAGTLRALALMHDQLEAEQQVFQQVVAVQVPAFWSAAKSPSAFAIHYRSALDSLHSEVGAFRARIVKTRDTLIQNAQALELADAAVQARLVELADRLNSPTPTTTTTTMQGSTPAASPVPSPSPSPSPSPPQTAAASVSAAPAAPPSETGDAAALRSTGRA